MSLSGRVWTCLSYEDCLCLIGISRSLAHHGRYSFLGEMSPLHFLPYEDTICALNFTKDTC